MRRARQGQGALFPPKFTIRQRATILRAQLPTVPTLAKWGIPGAVGLGVAVVAGSQTLLGLVGAGPGGFYEALQRVRPDEKRPTNAIARAALVALGAHSLYPNLHIPYAKAPGRTYGQAFKTGWGVLVTPFQRAKEQFLTPARQFRLGFARGYTEQMSQIRRYPARPYRTFAGGGGHPSWYKGQGGPMPAEHLGMSGDINFSLHKLRHRGFLASA